MNRSFLHQILPLSVLLVSGCAGVTHRSVPDAIADARAKGVRYYDTSPYLFIHTDNEGSLTSELVYLPDTTKKRAAKPYAIMAKNTAELTWDESGLFLTGATADVDATDVPVAVLGALEGVAKTFVTNARYDAGNALERSPQKAPSQAPEAYIFKIVKRDGQWGLVGAGTDNPKYKNP